MIENARNPSETINASNVNFVVGTVSAEKNSSKASIMPSINNSIISFITNASYYFLSIIYDKPI